MKTLHKNSPDRWLLFSSMNENVAIPGFSKIEGDIAYNAVLHVLRVQLRVLSASDNLSPSFQETEIIPWEGARDPGKIRSVLATKFNSLKRRLSAHEIPERKSYLEICNPSLEPDFLLTTCVNCKCPYCEISSGL